MSDWHDDEHDSWEQDRQPEVVRIVDEGADETRPAPRFALPDDGESWAASDDVSGGREQGGSVQMPHWSEPATGEVPRIRPVGDTSDDDFDSWSQVTSAGPCFRSDVGDWSEGDFGAGELAKDDSMSMGALADDDDEYDEYGDEEMYGPPPRRGRRGRRAPRTAVDDEPMPGPGGLEGHVGHDQGDGRDHGEAPTGQRVITGVIMAAVALAAFAAGRSIVVVLVAAILGACAFELFEAFRKAGYHTATIIGLLGCVAMPLAAYDQGERAFPLVAFIVIVFTFLWYLFEVVHARPSVNIALTLLVFGYVGTLGGFGGLLLGPDPGGTGLLLGVIICAVGSDVVGYFVGSQMGSTPLMPRISPNKTMEGAIAGAVAALVLGAIVGGALHPWADKGIGAGLALGLVVAVTAPLGDLCESLMKRDLGVKDFGGILPGHGGFLDRFDALLFTLPAAYYLVLALFT